MFMTTPASANSENLLYGYGPTVAVVKCISYFARFSSPFLLATHDRANDSA